MTRLVEGEAFPTRWRYRCCVHCNQDPLWHRENEPDTHLAPCVTSQAKCEDGGYELAGQPGIDLTYDDEGWCWECDSPIDACVCRLTKEE